MGEKGQLTEAVEDIEQSNQKHGYDVDRCAKLAKVEWALGKVPAPGENVGHEGNGVGDGGEDDEGAGEGKEGSVAA